MCDFKPGRSNQSSIAHLRFRDHAPGKDLSPSLESDKLELLEANKQTARSKACLHYTLTHHHQKDASTRDIDRKQSSADHVGGIPGLKHGEIIRNNQPIVVAIIKQHHAILSEFSSNQGNIISIEKMQMKLDDRRHKSLSWHLFLVTILVLNGFVGLTKCQNVYGDGDHRGSIRLGQAAPNVESQQSSVDGQQNHTNAKVAFGDIHRSVAEILNGTLINVTTHNSMADIDSQLSRTTSRPGEELSNGKLFDGLLSQSTDLVASTLANQLAPVASAATDHDTMVAMDSKKKKKMEKKKKKMEKKHKEWKKGKKHKKKKYESKKKKGGMEKKKKGKKMKKKWGEEKKGHKKKGDFKKKKWGHKKKMKKGHKKGKKGHKMLKDKGHKKKGFKKIYHKEEWGKKKKWHDIKREKKWNTKQKKWKKKWHQEKGKKYKGKHMKKYHKKNKHGKKYKKEKKSKWKKHKGEKFKKGHKKKKEEYSKKKEGGKKKKMKKFKKEEKKKKKG